MEGKETGHTQRREGHTYSGGRRQDTLMEGEGDREGGMPCVWVGSKQTLYNTLKVEPDCVCKYFIISHLVL